MCCRVFKFFNKTNNETIYLNGPDSADKNLLLKLYINWYNNEFIDELDDYDPITFEDFEYVTNFSPIDFYDDYRRFCNEN